MIHPTAIISPKARLDPSVQVGPYAIIDESVQLGAGCIVGPHVFLTGLLTAGVNNRFHAGCVIGDAPQDLKYDGTPTRVRIGDNNVFREHVTVHRATKPDGETVIGSNNLLMVFLGIEMTSVPSYAMVGFLKGRKLSSEAALKYVVYGAGAAGVMLYGISLLCGILGTPNLPEMAGALSRLAATGTTDKEEVIPFFDQRKEESLEYDITRLIAEVFPTEVQEFFQKYKDSFAGRGSPACPCSATSRTGQNARQGPRQSQDGYPGGFDSGCGRMDG